MIRKALIAALLFSGVAFQALGQEQDDDGVTRAAGAVLRGLDKVSGTISDFALAEGESASLGYLTIHLGECRYPTGNPSGDAFAWVDIVKEGETAPLFSGWMVASSPALSALDHPRYDVWVLRCTTD